MTLRPASTVLIALAVLAFTVPAWAEPACPPACQPLRAVQPCGKCPGCLNGYNRPLSEQVRYFCYTVARDFKRNNCWPKPFVCPDRATVRAPFNTMVNNGWERMNQLSEHHFEAASGELNEAGRLKVRWILVEAPSHHRTIFVRRGPTGSETTARLASVRRAAEPFMPEGEQPAIMETDKSPASWPASRVDAIDRMFRESAPPPRLPSADDGSNSQ